jgi:hypothetical protein
MRPPVVTAAPWPYLPPGAGPDSAVVVGVARTRVGVGLGVSGVQLGKKALATTLAV